MSDLAIKVEGLSKRYRTGQYVGSGRYQYKTLRDVLTDFVYAPFRRLRVKDKQQAAGSSPTSTGREPTPNPQHLSPSFIWALRNVSFQVKQGEVVGIIGGNGAGKTTLLKVLSRITEPTEGRVEIKGRLISLLEIGTGFHPELTGRENIYLSGAILGMTKKEIDRKFDEIVAFAELEKFTDTPVKRYSSGMWVRLGFAVAAHLEPEILLVDEVLAVGDIGFQKRCLGKMGDVAKEGRTVLFVSHSMPAILNLCDRGILLDTGKIRVAGSIRQVVDVYLAESIKLDGEVVLSEDRPHPKSQLKFVAVRILDADGHPMAYVDILKGLTLEIDYEVLQPVHSAQVAFELWNSMGICVLCSSDFDEHPEDARNIKYPGYYRVSCFIRPTYLRPGRYWIDLSSSIPAVEMLDEVRNAIAFEVIDSGGVEFKLSQGRRGVIIPILEWNTDRIS